ncbi:hypothetical protein H9638_06110 [Arthrobacter sp. Sa2BUA2]|uniref:Uncharacterized protein n=1 Tax=Arthrobacter pullicola TaxID=2762224 RepID=A0ABR8YGP2_9MICC|nr:hypothetical protein [Arthrobacter pullicola]MBD8043385.1 hypothetical protein [Arthrobacter pullicola]
MGNHTPSDDYRLYARPPAGQAQDPVQIVDDGGTVPSAVGRATRNDDPGVLASGSAGGRSAARAGDRAAARAGGRSAARAGDRDAARAGDRDAGWQHLVRDAGGSGASGRGDGSSWVDESTRVEEAGNPGRSDGVPGASVPGGFSASYGLSAPDGSRRWLNPYLCAAWALVAMMLAAGLFWLTGALAPPRYISVDPATGQGMEGMSGVIASNLYSMGPFLLLIGLIGALALLTVQAAGFRRVRAG